MAVHRIETFTRQGISVVRITADDGAEGWGQIAPSNADISATVLHRQVAPHVLGEDELSPASGRYAIDRIADRVIDRNHKFPWSYVCRALAGIDTALWDLMAKRKGIPVVSLLGGTPRPIAVYGSAGRRDTTGDEEADRLVRACDEKGFRAFKIKIGTPCGHDADSWPGRSESVIRAVRKALGPDIAIMADANSCYTPARAIEVGRVLEEIGAAHFEEPCPYWELEWTAEVAAALDVPVAGGEQDNDLAQWRRMMRMRAVDVVQPDMCYVGGIARALRVSRMAAEAGLPVTPHSPNRSLVSVFTLHYLGAIPNAGPYMEYSMEPVKPPEEELYFPVLAARDGCVPIPDGPGWGVEINPGWLAKADRAVSERE